MVLSMAIRHREELSVFLWWEATNAVDAVRRICELCEEMGARRLWRVLGVRTSQKECFRGNDPTKCNPKIVQTRISEGNL
jgi:hypothetical protein